MELTAENYYDNATSFDYMSTSLYKDFRKSRPLPWRN